MNDEVARQPNDSARFCVERANANDLEGIVALFEPDALVAGPNGSDVVGHQAIRAK